ncbi:hypothetical protein HO173_010316 [Letharia columbiana]|uniref:Uncharacterized protein n=1 Tax=Letharia columbiana TaxID=112416 RepID=A0A8H6FN40_9LECA|nr:uncharacterized protein HO173_010316 [Letharia columbiana]KAF6231564.1 hypothetical protein HO173_010316 [Letharia columbiana]
MVPKPLYHFAIYTQKPWFDVNGRQQLQEKPNASLFDQGSADEVASLKASRSSGYSVQFSDWDDYFDDKGKSRVRYMG